MRYVMVILIAGMLAGGAPALADPISDSLATLSTIGPEGQGNRAAASAWNTLSQAKAGDLPRLLTALNSASPLAANWIRAAIDAVAEREIAAKHPLPTAELEQFTLDTKNAPRVRRLAFEWLAEVDHTAADRLIPGMLHDPSVEFRRDAVERLIAEGTAAVAAGNNDAGLAAYRKALTGARDLDQVNLLAAELEKLGDKVDLVAHFGYLTGWSLLGPFDNTEGVGFGAVYEPETKLDLTAELDGKHGKVAWKQHTTDKPMGLVDLNAAIGKESAVVAYACTEFFTDHEQDVEIRYTSVNANRLWVNGKVVASNEVYHAASGELDQYMAKVHLQAGRNTILIKVCQNAMTEDWAQVWQFQLRVCDSTGGAIPSTKTLAAAE